MKKALAILAGLAMAGTAFAQSTLGTIKLENNNTIKTDGSGTFKLPIYVDVNKNGTQDAGEVGIGTYAQQNSLGSATLGLFVAGSSTPFATALFRTDANGAFLGTPSTQTVDVPGSTPGSQPSLTLRAWVGASFATSPVQGEWTFTPGRALGGTPAGGGTPILPSGLAGLGNELTNAGLGATLVPEPSTIAFAAIGVGALLLRRRKA